jgi:zinc transport system substrate-binding protein
MKNISLISLAVIWALLLTGCSMWEKNITTTETPKPVIVTSFFPLTHIVEKIVWDQAEVVQILPEGAEGHGYEPTPEQMKIIEKSDLVIVLGESMESYSEKLKTIMASKNKAYLDFSDTVININEIEEEHHDEHEEENKHDHGGLDPHIWLSPRSYAQMADIITKKIQESFSTINIEESAWELKKELATLDEEFTSGLSQCETRKFVTSHAAFGYLARDYNLTQIAVAGISPEEEPAPKVIAGVIEVVKKEKISALFSEPLVSPKLINTISAETGAKTYLLHPLESLTGDETALGYVWIMRQNLGFLREGMGCQ